MGRYITMASFPSGKHRRRPQGRAVLSFLPHTCRCTTYSRFTAYPAFFGVPHYCGVLTQIFCVSAQFCGVSAGRIESFRPRVIITGSRRSQRRGMAAGSHAVDSPGNGSDWKQSSPSDDFRCRGQTWSPSRDVQSASKYSDTRHLRVLCSESSPVSHECGGSDGDDAPGGVRSAIHGEENRDPRRGKPRSVARNTVRYRESGPYSGPYSVEYGTCGVEFGPCGVE